MEKKKIICLLLCGLLMQVLAGCTDKAPEYPDLEGYWKTERIVNNQTGEKMPCNRLFWALQLGLVELKDLGENGFGGYIGRFEYDEKAKTLRIHNVVFQGNQTRPAEEKNLINFGLPSIDTVFDVLSLDGHRMVLRSDMTTLYFRSF